MIQTQEDLIMAYLDEHSADRDEPCNRCGEYHVRLLELNGQYVCDACAEEEEGREWEY